MLFYASNHRKNSAANIVFSDLLFYDNVISVLKYKNITKQQNNYRTLNHPITKDSNLWYTINSDFLIYFLNNFFLKQNEQREVF